MRRRILSKLKVVNNLPSDAKGAHVVNALSVDAGIRVSKVYAKRVLGDATGLTKSAFRKAFTELPCLIDYLTKANAAIYLQTRGTMVPLIRCFTTSLETPRGYINPEH